jgi:hypothetical protein
MPPLPVSQQTEDRIALLFPIDRQRALARTILSEQCGHNLPFMRNASEAALERLQFAALKLSDGNLDKLNRAVDLANRDWRDLLMAGGFGERIDAHESWRPEQRKG